MPRLALWLGTFSDEDALDQFLDIPYDEAGDARSEFGKLSGMEWYDEDFLEAEWDGKGLMNILPKLSFADSFLPALRAAISEEEAARYNSVIVLYELEPGIMPRSAGPIRLLGVFFYED